MTSRSRFSGRSCVIIIVFDRHQICWKSLFNKLGFCGSKHSRATNDELELGSGMPLIWDTPAYTHLH